MSLSLLSNVYAESPPTIKVPAGYEIVAQYGSGYTYTANGNEEKLLFDTYIVRVPTDTTVIANVIPSFDISHCECSTHDWDNLDENTYEFDNGYDLTIHSGCKEPEPTIYVPWEKSDLYDFYGVLYSDKNYENIIQVYFFLANADSGETVDKTKLSELLNTVTDNNTNYYLSNDRYNGNPAETITDKRSGFWAEFTAVNGPRARAQRILASDVPQADIDDTVVALRVAISKLIPTTRANTTLLHEAIEAATITEKDDYTPRSWAAYSEAKDAAIALMGTMFADGKPTQANKATANDTISAAAESLRNKQKALDLRVSKYGKDGETRVKLMASALEELNRRFSAPDALNGYTPESVAALQSALKTANETLAETPVYSAIGQLESSRLTNAVRAARAAAAGLETESQEPIHVKLSALDAYDVYQKRTDMWWALHNKNILTTELTLPANASAASVLREKNLLKRTLNESKYDPSLLVFRNGELLNTTSMFTYNDIGVEGGVFESLKLHDGDELTLVWICGKQIMYSSTAGYYTQYLYEIPAYFRYSRVEAPAEVVAGEAFEVTVTSDAALPFLATGEKTPVVGATIRRSATEADAETVSTNYVHRNTYQTTDENGKATLTLYNEGYVLINAFRTEDEEGRYIVGPSVLVHVLPTNDLESVKLQLRKELDEVYYDENYPESVFTPENWRLVKDAYENGVQAIANAETLGVASSEQESAIQEIKRLQSTADSGNNSNLKKFRDILAELPNDVNKLDKSAEARIEELKTAYEAMTDYQRSELSEQEIARYEEIINAKLKEAQKHRLKFEQAFSDGVTEDDQKTILAMIDYLKKNTPNEDWYQQKPESGIGNQKLAELFTFNTVKGAKMNSDETNQSYVYKQLDESYALQRDIYACISPEYAAYILCRDAALENGNRNGPGEIRAADGSWSISDENMQMYVPDSSESNTTRVLGKMTFTINGTEYAIRSIKVTGLEHAAQKSALDFYDGTAYRGRSAEIQCNQIVQDSFLNFTMPFDDVTITVTWGPVAGTTSEVEKARTDALTALEAILNNYAEKYDAQSETYLAIKAKYDEGVAKIEDKDQTSTVDAINAERRSTANAMAKAAAGNTGTDDEFLNGWGDPDNDKGFYAGNYVGTVKVIVENTTYSGAPKGFYTNPDDPDYDIEDSIVYRESYAIGDEDSMMTVILRALADDGYEWTGTGGSKFGITYLSSISNSQGKLGEFDGGDESGWMGTLNGFFVNLSFAEFTVEKNQNTNIQLADGDVIHVMYTSTGLGEDLGGTFYNSDTTLKALKVMDGDKTLVLAPEFEASAAEPGGTYSYTVMIDDNATELTILADAANKNYLVKRFLNEKVTDNTEGSSYYKSTQAIPVVSGDTIYIGCGEPVWPSMNNQSTEAREYVGTWYELHIVSASSGGTEVDAQIDALPNPDDLTYENRENYRQDIVQAKKAMDALKDSKVDEVRAKKLTDLCEKLAGFDAVDEVKAAIAKLPSVSNAALEDEESINAAKEKYDALDTELLKYLKASEKQKLSDLLQRMKELNEELLTKLVVTPDTVTAVVDAKTKTIQLVGYITEGEPITLNGEPITRSGSKFTLGNTVYRVVLNVTERPINVTLDEKRPEIAPAEDATDDTKKAAAAITSPSTTSDGLAAAAADHLTETARKQAEASGDASASVTAEVKLNISVEKYEEVGGKQELTLDITPQVTYTVTADGQTLSTKTETLDNSAIKAPVTISVALPLDMPQENLYVKHKLEDGSFEYIKPTIERNVATWQQSSFSIVVLTADSRTATVKMNDLDVTLTPEDVGKELPTVTKPGKDFTGWTFVIDGTEYPGGPYTKLTDDLLTKLSEANEVTATPNFKNKTSSGGSSSGKIESPNKPNKSTMGEADASKFRDVAASDWYFDAVQYVLEKGLMNGTSDWTFAPNDATTRGMIVTILARVEGVNTNGNPWYAASQKWAMDNGISDGTNMPGVITREQLATILYRYAKQKGYDVSKSAALTGFSDADKVSGYAFDAMQWAVAEELLKGSNGKLDPQGSATRAQVATILMRFMQKYEK